MTDDIVSDLRTLADEYMAWDEDNGDRVLLLAAADAIEARDAEIERLRAEVAELWDFIDEMPSGTESFYEWLEARRG